MKRGKFKFQKNAGSKVGEIEDLKNRLADNEMSPFQFYTDYFRKHDYSHRPKSYKGFLRDLNYYDVYTYVIKRATEDFRLHSE